MLPPSQQTGTAADSIQHQIKVSLIGNPNCGKSTLFNALTGLNQKIANFPGVTVEKKSGNAKIYHSGTGKPTSFEVTDLPGTYSLYPKSPDERIPFQVLCDPNDPNHPEMVVILADGTNLKRSLFLASQVIDLKIPAILALNMMDLVERQGLKIKVEELERRLGVKVVPINARKGEGIEELKQAMLMTLTVPQHDVYATANLAPRLLNDIRTLLKLPSDYAALQIAHHADAIPEFHLPGYQKEAVMHLLDQHKLETAAIQSHETLERYKVIHELLKDCLQAADGVNKPSMTKRVDAFLMHRVWGYVFFLALLFVIFQAIFSLAQIPMDYIDQAFSALSAKVAQMLPHGTLNELIVNGILAGIGGIIIFVPQIALLFTFIAILEDSGYMARVSFLMDKLMRKFGLNGRSVIPLISGVACAVPAILSARTIGSWKERLITIFITPLMSCSARLPVYTLLIALVVPQQMVGGIVNLQGLVMMSLYLIGFIAALAAAALMNKFIKTKEKTYFIMELPVYRRPRWSNIVYAIAEKVRIFLFDAGKIIVLISVILWYLSSRGPGQDYAQISQQITQLEATNPDQHSDEMHHLEAKRLEYSYAGRMGHMLEPMIKPLGFDWKIGIALVTSFAAREVFVGTMSTIYSAGKDSETMSVRDKMQADINPETGLHRYTLASGWSLMLFYAFAMQCMSTMAVVRRETGGWKWTLLQFLFFGALAYLSSFTIFHLLS